MSAAPLRIVGTSGSVDATGVVSIEIPMNVATLSEALSVTASNIGISLPLVSRNFKQSDDGSYDVTLHYEGLSDDEKSDDTSFEFDVSLSEDPIESHPRFDAIAAKYGWDETERAFPKFAPQAKKSGGALGAQEKPQKSPLYGVESYLAVGAVFRKTYASRAIPSGVLRGIGTIVARPPNIGAFNLPSSGSKRNWLKLAPKIRRRGNSVEVVEEWMLSGPNGWNSDIYNAGQLDEGE